MKAEVIGKKADYIGIAGSVLCLVHCLAAPLLVMTSTMLRTDSALREGFLGLDYLFIVVNMAAVYFATRQTQSHAIRTGLWSFLALFTVSLLLEEADQLFEYLAYAASAGLVIFHMLNIRLQRTAHGH